MRFIFLCGLVLFCAACQKNVKLQNDIEADWTMTAKLAIRNVSDSGSGQLVWQQRGPWVWAKFAAPLGQGNWTLDEQKIQLIDASGQHWFAANMNELLLTHLQIKIPWKALKNWLQGHWPEPLTEGSMSFVYEGWQVELKKIAVTPMGHLMPQRITIKKGKQSLKLAIKTWQT